MSSFKKAGTTDSRIPGTQSKNGVPCVSSGIPSLDFIIGGSIPVGTVFMIEEDVLSNYSRVMSKFFLAEAAISKQAILLASLDDDPRDIVKELPSPISVGATDIEQGDSSMMDKMKIAWRYESQAVVDSTFGTNANFGHNFDLSRHMGEEMIKNCEISYWSPAETHSKSTDFKNPYYYELLCTIKDLLKKPEHRISNREQAKVLRICALSMGSPIWAAHELEEDFNPNECGRDIMKFVYCLRIMLRGTTAVALLTVPTHLFEDNHLVKRLLNSVDTAVRLESFAGSDRETNPVFKDYHGLFHITKLSAINTLVPYLPPSLDLAFKLRRKKFIIEKLHLPPELQESSEREQDDITASAPTCGGFKKKDIDF